MNEAEYLMKNYGERGGCYPSRPWAKADNTLREKKKNKKNRILGPGQSSPAILLSPNSFDSWEPVPEAKDLVVTLEKGKVS